ncbi:MAG: inositol monophosphatase [Desulfovibrio sp.]|nr:inositol monophosphatase [Desulfovibrio sp.]
MSLASSLLEPCLQIVQQSGEIIKANWIKQHKVRYKGRIDLVTETDLAVEDFLKNRLAALVPDAAFMAEESSTLGQNPDQLCWIIDPVDGTTNFVHRIPQVGTSVALWQEDRVVLAIVNVPTMKECYWAVRGEGAFCNGNVIHVSRAAKLSETLVATGFPYDAGDHISLIMRRLVAVLPGSQGMRRIGAASVDLSYLACGKIDAFYEDWLKPWDVAAGWLIVEEAGGKVSNFKNEPYTFYEPLLATNGLMHEELSQLLQVADDFSQHLVC